MLTQEQQARTLSSAKTYGLRTPEMAALFLSAAESPEDWHLRIKYIAAWTGDPKAIPAEWWEKIRNDPWVITTAMTLGVVRQPTPGVEVENIVIEPA